MLFDGAPYYCGTRYVSKGTVISDIRPFNRHQSHGNSYYGLWLASPSTRVEMEHYYLSNTRFKFCCPKDLEIFVDQLSTYEWSLLRLVTLEVSRDLEYSCPLKEWMSACARLPPNLVSIQFNASNWNLMGAEIHGQWFIVKTCPRDTPGLDLRRAIISIDTLGKLAHRVAAKAKIGLAVRDLQFWEVAEIEVIQVRVLDELEPWSKNWLSWWEEETKIDFEGGETFNKVA